MNKLIISVFSIVFLFYIFSHCTLEKKSLDESIFDKFKDLNYKWELEKNIYTNEEQDNYYFIINVDTLVPNDESFNVSRATMDHIKGNFNYAFRIFLSEQDLLERNCLKDEKARYNFLKYFEYKLNLKTCWVEKRYNANSGKWEETLPCLFRFQIKGGEQQLYRDYAKILGKCGREYICNHFNDVDCSGDEIILNRKRNLEKGKVISISG